MINTVIPKIALIAALGVILSGSGAVAEKFQLPVDCQLGKDCFIQNYPDMASGNDFTDPFCGAASYDTHKGLDIRLRSLVDMERNVPVLAVADGTVLRYRDGEPDRLITAEQLSEVAGKECGNALVIKHEDGIEVQYCHMKQGSVAVRPGVQVKAGQKIGIVGSSGKSEIPHLHITTRLDGEVIDPVTGRMATDGCQSGAADPQRSFFSAEVLPFMAGQSDLLGIGISDQMPDYDKLVVNGVPPTAKLGGSATIGWLWFVNVKKGDRIRMIIRRPDGLTLIDNTSDPLSRNRGAYGLFGGRRQPPVPGEYFIRAELIRDETVVLTQDRSILVEE